MSSSPEHRAELELSSSKEVSKSLSSSSARDHAWPVLERVAALLADHPARDGRSDDRRMDDFVKACRRAALVRRVGFGPEEWACCCLGHALVKRELGAEPIAALWWAATRAKGLSELEKIVTPNLEELLRKLGSPRKANSRPASFDHDPAKKPEVVKKLSLEDWLAREKREGRA